jgi:curved DNA-binding protein CbpA
MPPSTAELEDYWQILGLAPGASKSEVSKAYRKKSLHVHPDRYKGDDPQGATEEFLRLTRAKEVLEDDKARAAFENVQRARAMHKEKQAAQDGVRRRFREELEAREEEARKRARTGASAQAQQMQSAQEEKKQADAEASARKELQRELERLRRTGRLDGQSVSVPAAPPPSQGGSSASAAGSGEYLKATVRWNVDDQHIDKGSLHRLLVEYGAPADVALGIVGGKAVFELPPEAAKKLAAHSVHLGARGVRLTIHQAAGDVPALSTGDPAHAASKAQGVGPQPQEEDLPPGWCEQLTPDGQRYFYHSATRDAQWERPTHGSAEAFAPASEHERLEATTLARLRQASERQKLVARDAQAAH